MAMPRQFYQDIEPVSLPMTVNPGEKEFAVSDFDVSATDTDTLQQFTGHATGRPAITYGPAFDRWLVMKSFSLIRPVFLMGVWATLAAAAVAWPVIYLNRLWEENVTYLHMAAWQCGALVYFLAPYIAIRTGLTQGLEKKSLASIIVTGQLLFSWFAFITWKLYGDLSVFALTSIVVATVFSFPGYLRRAMYVLSAVFLGTCIYASGARPEFFGEGGCAVLVIVVLMSFGVDSYMMNLNRALYHRQRMVEIERARADEILYNALPASIANELKNNNVVKAEKFDGMTVLFADIVGFTQFSSTIPPDVLVHVLNQIFSEFDTLVDRYQVEKIKTIGDAYMVIGKDNAQGVALLALDLLQIIQQYNQRNGTTFALRIGMHVGPTVAGVIGLKRFLYDVWGDAVNMASRMESTGVPGRIQVSDAIHQELKGKFEFEARGEVEVKGKGSMPTYFLLAAQPNSNQQA